MKIRITSKNLQKAQIGINLLPTSGLMKWATHKPTTADLAASVADPTGIANVPFVVDAAKNMIKDPSWGHGADLFWNVLGSIPVVGKLAKGTKAVAATPKIAKEVSAARKVGNIAGKVIKPVVKTIEAPATIANKAWSKIGVVTPSTLNTINTFNRGMRGWEAGAQGAISGLDYLFPGTPQKEYGGESSNIIKIKITGKGLTKAQYQNSQIGKPLSFPTFQQSVQQVTSGACPDGYQKNPITGQCEIKPNYGASNSPQIRTNLGYGFIRNPQTGMYSKPAEPNYGEGIYKGIPSKSKKPLRSIAHTFDNLFTAGEIASNIYRNFTDKKDYNRQAHLENLPDVGQVVPGDDYGMWTTNQDRQDPRKQYTVNIGQSTNRFEPMMAYGKDGLIVPEHVMDAYVPSPYPSIPTPAAMPPADVSAIVGKESPQLQSSSKSDIRNLIAEKESGGNYKALPRKKDGTLASSAVGKYQFLWNSNKDWITKITGVTSKNEFMNNPDAQEAAFDYWDENILTPNAIKIKQELGVDLPIENIKYAIHFAGPTGAYRYFKTGEDTNDVFGTNIKKITKMKFDDGGETTNIETMKILITDVPQNLDSMAYGGQLGYGFDLGQRNTYSAMKKNPYENSSSTLQPVPREQANIEAEKGETAYGDLDGDGQNEHMKIGGERHSNGGTPLNVAPGSFIFSDTAKMRIKDPEVLKYFGLSSKKGGYTPAEIAKKYDINKYKGILQDPYGDSIQKATAQRMIDNYEQKLGYLALIQEAMKGFPQGIPEVAENIMGGPMQGDQSQQPNSQEPTEGQPEEQAQEQGMEEEPMMRWGGGLRKFQGDQDGSTVPGPKTFRVGDRDINATYFPYGQPPAGYNPYPGITNLYERPGIEGTSKIISAGNPPGKGSQSFNRAFSEARRRGDSIFTWNGKKYTTDIYNPKQKVVITQEVPAAYAYTEEPTTTPTTPAAPGSETPKEGEEGKTTTTIGAPNVDVKGNPIPFGYDIRDTLNTLNALKNYTGVRKDLFNYQKINPVLPQIAMDSYLGKLQARWQGYNQVANQIGQMMPGNSAVANLSFAAGAPAEGGVQDISQTNLNNIQAFIQNQKEKADILNNAIAYNAGVTDKNRELRFNVNRQFGTDKRLAGNALVQAINQRITNATDRYNLNQVESPYYYIDPISGRMVFNPEGGRAAFENMRRMGYKGNTDYMSAQAQAAVKVYNDVYDNTKGSPSEKAAAANTAMSRILGGRQSTSLPAQATGAAAYRHGGQHTAAYGYSYNNPFLI